MPFNSAEWVGQKSYKNHAQKIFCLRRYNQSKSEQTTDQQFANLKSRKKST